MIYSTYLHVSTLGGHYNYYDDDYGQGKDGDHDGNDEKGLVDALGGCKHHGKLSSPAVLLSDKY